MSGDEPVRADNPRRESERATALADKYEASWRRAFEKDAEDARERIQSRILCVPEPSASACRLILERIEADRGA